MEATLRGFEGIPNKDARALNGMIGRVAMIGDARKSLELFDQMVDRGLELFDQMETLTELNPGLSTTHALLSFRLERARRKLTSL